MENNTGKKRTRLNLEQREALLSFMEKNPALATGRFPGPQGSKIKAQLWNELSEHLNRIGSIGHGTTKTPDRWIKSWQDWRCDIKAKAWRLRHTGMNQGAAQLTPIEERLIAFMGNEFHEEHPRQDHSDVTSGHNSDESTQEFTLVFNDNALTVDISSPSPSGSHNLSPVASSSISPPVTSLAQSTSSYPSTSQRQMKNEHSSDILRSPNRTPSPVSQDQNSSQILNTSSLNNDLYSMALRKRRRAQNGQDEQRGNTVDDEERAVCFAERLAAAMKAQAEALFSGAAAEERRATAAERKATALEREASAAERRAAAAERHAAAAERIAAAVEKEFSFADKR